MASPGEEPHRRPSTEPPRPRPDLEQLMRELDDDRSDRWPIPEEHWTPAFRALMQRTRKSEPE
jgi:hypothetical protein